MYSQESISGHRRGRPEPTAETLSGLACLICATDYRDASAPEAVVVSHRDDRQLLACRGTCARMAGGSVDGLDETPLPLDERVRRHQGPAPHDGDPHDGDPS
ncbi:hypothetical protein BM536_026725 [Streptomyces phaeoluteigriseus]|uniref:Uncharacterized protein n=1 Tax=Streptomyces phaeoluteigriseus TaxID=114686 RepID=A0A1V6MNG5_9ACTN|nr:hypothetical protein [Streptomyces phaeoluteigriseus]OQD53843.1 hypothetical protein BM536_026725 [Streptomyces phaeoluteigriseus]